MASPFFSTAIRYGTFIAAISGVWLMSDVLQTIHAQDKSIPPPPVAPPEKPPGPSVAATGILEALRENISLGVPVPGLVTKVNVSVSDNVKAGDSLFELDDRELRAQLLGNLAQVEVAKANLSVAEAQLVKAKDILNRLKSVPDPRAISEDELKNSANEVLVAEAFVIAAQAQLSASRADVARTELLIDRLIIRAPRDGTILQSNIRPGEYASTTSKNPPMVLGDRDQFQVRADVDEQNASLIRPGQSGEAFLKGSGKDPIALTFLRIEPFVIPKVSLTGASTERVDTRVLQVIFRVEQKPGSLPLYVGQQVDVFIKTGEIETPALKKNP